MPLSLRPIKTRRNPDSQVQVPGSDSEASESTRRRQVLLGRSAQALVVWLEARWCRVSRAASTQLEHSRRKRPSVRLGCVTAALARDQVKVGSPARRPGAGPWPRPAVRSRGPP